MAASEDLVHGWVSTHCGRGTSDILWSCLATILLSVWTVIHLPVPCCSRFEDGKLVSGEPSRSWRNWVIRSGTVPAVTSIIAPEFDIYGCMGAIRILARTKKDVTDEVDFDLCFLSLYGRFLSRIAFRVTSVARWRSIIVYNSEPCGLVL